MKIEERAAQIWPLLTWAGTNRQVLPYKILSKLIGVPKPGLGQLLEPIQSYCILNKLPPLTVIVVGDASGVPGTGFTAGTDIPREQMKVFEFNWLGQHVPTVDEFLGALMKQPSRAVPGWRP